jgi:hypothetical protein
MAGPGWSAFGHRCRVETSVPTLGTYLAEVFGDLPQVQDAEHVYRLEELSDGRWVTRLDGEVVDEPGDAPRAVGLLLWRINRGAVEDSQDLVLLHAGGVIVDGAGVVLAGDMEFGKTTLTTGLLRAGADYLTDEAIGLALDDELLHGYPRSLSLDEGSWRLFPDLEPELPDILRPYVPHQWQVPASSLPGVTAMTQAIPRLIVLPRYRSGATLTVRRLPGAEALLRLSACVFPSPLPRRRILERLARLLRAAPCYEMEHGDLSESVDAVRALVETSSVEHPGGGAASLGDGGGLTAGSPPPCAHDDDRHPVPRHDAAVLDVGDEWVLHVAATDEVHRLDALGLSLWERLDGRRSLADLIADVASSRPPGDRELVAAKVRGFVSELEALQLVD